LAATGRDIIDLSVGQPDFNTPEHIIEAACQAVRDGATGYTPTPGTPELREAVAREMGRQRSIDIEMSNVLVSPGAKYSLAMVILALVDPRQKILIPSPYWVSYPKMAQLAGAEVVVVPTAIEQGYKLTPDILEPYLDERCRLLILNSPSNPSGVGYTNEDLKPIAELLKSYPDLWVLSDDIYQKLVYDGFEPGCLAAVDEEVARRCVYVDGVSKAYAMTGWRIGYMAGPESLVSAIGRMQSHTTSNPAAVSQAAALEALTGPQDCVGKMCRAFARRRAKLLERMEGIDGLCWVVPDGAFYVFANVSQVLGKRHPETGEPIDTDQKLGDYLLEGAGVAAVPGVAFGAPGHLRMSYAASETRILEAMDRIEQALGALR
jgi:aspartate aminotransferase